MYSVISSLLLRLKFLNVVKKPYPYVTFSGKEPLRNPRCISDSTGSVQERHQNYPFHCHPTHDKSGFISWHKVNSRNDTWPTEGNQQTWKKIVYVVGLQIFLSVYLIMYYTFLCHQTLLVDLRMNIHVCRCLFLSRSLSIGLKRPLESVIHQLNIYEELNYYRITTLLSFYYVSELQRYIFP